MSYRGYLPLHGPGHLKRTIKRTCSFIQRKGFQFDAIAFSGYSGSLLAIPVALELHKNMIVVRKTIGGSHGDLIEGKPPKRYIVIDDFMSTGDTLRRIIRSIDRQFEWVTKRSKCIAVILAKQKGFYRNEQSSLHPIPIYEVR